jgi:hypothetical protein
MASKFNREQLNISDYNNHQLHDFAKRDLRCAETEHLGCVDCLQFIPSSFDNQDEGTCIGKPLRFCESQFCIFVPKSKLDKVPRVSLELVEPEI